MKTKNLSFAFKCLISALLVGYIFSRIEPAKVFLVLQKLDLSWAVAGSVLMPGMIFLLAWRWRLFLRRRSMDLPVRKVFLLTWTGQFFNSVLPGSTGGDLFKIYQICRVYPNGKMTAAGTVIADRGSALASLLLLIGFSLGRDPLLFGKLWQGLGPWQLSPMMLTVVGGVVIGAVIGFVLFLRSKAVRVWISDLARVLKEAAFDRSFFQATVLSLFIHCLSFLIFFCFARALGISITFFQVLIILPILLFVVLLPVTVNGHGLREIVTVFFFQHLAIAAGTTAGVTETVVALSVVLLVNDLLWNLPAGLWYLYRSNRS